MAGSVEVVEIEDAEGRHHAQILALQRLDAQGYGGSKQTLSCDPEYRDEGTRWIVTVRCYGSER